MCFFSGAGYAELGDESRWRLMLELYNKDSRMDRHANRKDVRPFAVLRRK